MAGLYIHIPFCARRCLYCDFYSNVEAKYKETFLTALLKEMEMRRDYLGNEPVETIYMGGGTPSQLAADDLRRIFDKIYSLFSIKGEIEVTLEANPDDMTPDYVKSIRRLPVNRISMGIQSFHDADLAFLQRRHNSKQAIQAVSLCKENGLNNISIDLIYGLPGQTTDAWKKNIDDAIRLEIPHLSAYHLIYEEGTKLYRLKESGKVKPVDEETSLSFFSAVTGRLTEAGYIHYEISNFAYPGNLSIHNSSYWTGKKYLGVGPSAHSYNKESRQWNVSSLTRYIKGITANNPATEIEVLNIYDKYNDYIITGLRTMWGISLSYILTNFGKEIQNYCLRQAAPFINRGMIRYSDDKLLLSREGLFISDGIMSDLLWV
ncbi:MAG: radical SAM family heme chaperone HemW [Tannerellaceae bacterium]|jgi:oxygen-independent coproporphyrinogen-3 oxidase|nr:radical SAM family heme chaperone HemW [Tannerellaceae bacterium]